MTPERRKPEWVDDELEGGYVTPLREWPSRREWIVGCVLLWVVVAAVWGLRMIRVRMSADAQPAAAAPVEPPGTQDADPRAADAPLLESLPGSLPPR